MIILSIVCKSELENKLKSAVASGNILTYESIPVSDTESEFTFVLEHIPGIEYDEFLDDNIEDANLRLMYHIDIRERNKNLRNFTVDTLHGKKNKLLKKFINY